MKYLGILGGIAGMFLLACLSPGPVWVVITSTSFAVSRKAGLLTGLGVVFSIAPIQAVYRRAKATIDTLVGVVLIALGIRLAVSQ